MIETIDKIYSRKDGRFEIRYHYGYKDDDTSNYKSVYGNSETEVIKNYHKTIDDLISKNDLLIYDKTYIGYYIYLWLNNSKIKNKKSTYSNYQYAIKSRIIPKFASVKKKTISLELVNKFTADLLSEGLVEKYHTCDNRSSINNNDLHSLVIDGINELLDNFYKDRELNNFKENDIDNDLFKEKLDSLNKELISIDKELQTKKHTFNVYMKIVQMDS